MKSFCKKCKHVKHSISGCNHKIKNWWQRFFIKCSCKG